MNESNTEAPPTDAPSEQAAPDEELIRLRAHAGELLAEKKNADKRAKGFEDQLQAALVEVENLKVAFQDFHIKRPLARLAEEISPIPDVWTAEFTKKYKVEAEGDDLRIFTLDGKPCLIPKGFINAGQPIKFTASDVWGLLCWYVPDTKAPEVKRMAAMTNYFGPQGSGAGSSTYSKPPGAPQTPKTDKAPAVPLGLR